MYQNKWYSRSAPGRLRRGETIIRPRRGSLLQELGPLNPWWSNPTWEAGDPFLQAAARSPYIRRPAVLDDVAPPNVYTLRGPRRAGKSTVLKQTISRLVNSGVDPRRLCYFAADSVETFRDLINVFQVVHQLFPDLGDIPRYFFIDKITAIAHWQRAVKWARDNTTMVSDCIVVTGSSATDVAEGTYQLAGRRGPAVELDRLLLPMAFPEFVRCAGYPLPTPTQLPVAAFYSDDGRRACADALVHLDLLVNAFEAYLTVGGFPQAVAAFRVTAAVTDGFARDLWDVVQADLYRAGISRPEVSLSFIERIVASMSAPLAMPTLADHLGIDRRTAAAWIDALVSTYLVLVLFKEKGGIADINSLRKIYPIDPIIAWLSSRQAAGIDSPNLTHLAEAAAAMGLLRTRERNSVDGLRGPKQLFYFRSPNRAEIDFLILPERMAIESKYIDTPDRRELRAMQDNFGDGLLLTRSAVDLQPGGSILPVSVFCWLLDQGE